MPATPAMAGGVPSAPMVEDGWMQAEMRLALRRIRTCFGEALAQIAAVQGPMEDNMVLLWDTTERCEADWAGCPPALRAWIYNNLGLQR